MSRETRLVKKLESKPEIKTPIANDIFLPNYSVVKGASNLFTPGSLLFTGSNGSLSEDNNNLFYDYTNNCLGIGTSNPETSLDANGVIRATGEYKTTPFSGSGAGAYMSYRSGDDTAWFFGYDETGGLGNPGKHISMILGNNAVKLAMDGNASGDAPGVYFPASGFTLFFDSINSKVGVGTLTTTQHLVNIKSGESIGSDGASNSKLMLSNTDVQLRASNKLLEYVAGVKSVETSSTDKIFYNNLGVEMLRFERDTNHLRFPSSPGAQRIYGKNNVYMEFYNNTTGGFVFHAYAATHNSRFDHDLDIDGDLTVGGTFQPSNLILTNSAAYIKGGSNYHDQSKIIFYDGSSVDMHIQTGNRTSTANMTFDTNSGTERMRLTDTGELLIGTTSEVGGHLLSLKSGQSIGSDGASNSKLYLSNTDVQLRASDDLKFYTSGTLRGTFGNTTGVLSLAQDQLVIETSKTPSSASDTGTAGAIAWDSNYIYVCVATDTWKRVAISTW